MQWNYTKQIDINIEKVTNDMHQSGHLLMNINQRIFMVQVNLIKYYQLFRISAKVALTNIDDSVKAAATHGNDFRSSDETDERDLYTVANSLQQTRS